MPKLPLPPSSLTGPIAEYLTVIWVALNAMPNFSGFSGTTPNSVVTGFPGDFAFNVGSASTNSRIWVMGGSTRVPANTGWNIVRMA